MRIVFAKIEVSCVIGTCNKTVSAADASAIIDHDYSVFTLPRSVYRTDGNTGRILTLHAGSRNEAPRYVGISADLFFDYWPIGYAGRKYVLRYACDRASLTAHTFPEVYDHYPPPLLDRFLESPRQILAHRHENILMSQNRLLPGRRRRS